MKIKFPISLKDTFITYQHLAGSVMMGAVLLYLEKVRRLRKAGKEKSYREVKIDLWRWVLPTLFIPALISVFKKNLSYSYVILNARRRTKDVIFQS